MKKSFFVFLIGTVLVFSLFAGGNADRRRAKVDFWGHADVAMNASYRSIIDRYHHSQSEIEIVPTFFPYDDFESKIMTSLLSGRGGADLYQMWGGWAPDFINSGTLTTVPIDLIQDILSDSYDPVTAALRGPDGRYYGVPIDFNNEFGGMFVNKREFERQGIPYPTTWEEIIDVAKRTTVRRGNTFEMKGFDFPNCDSTTYLFLTMILSNGGQYWVNGRFNFTTPQAEQAMTTLVNWILVDQVTNTDGHTLPDELEPHQNFAQGRVMMTMRGPWTIGELEMDYNIRPGVDYDYIKVPFPGPIQAFPAETGFSFGVPKKSKVIDAAWSFVRYIMMPQNLMPHNVASANIPPRKSVAHDPSLVRQMPYMAPLLEILPYAQFIGPFNTDVLKEAVEDVFLSLCHRDGRFTSVSAAMAALERRVNTDLRL